MFAGRTMAASTAVNLPRLALRAGVALALTVLITLTVIYAGLLAGGKVRIEQTDFLVYFSAAHLVAAGHSDWVYQFAHLKPVEAGYLRSLLLVRNEAVFLYPPVMALLMAPLAWLPFTAAFALWTLSNAALGIWSLSALGRYARLSRSGLLLFAAAGLSFFPVFASVVQGQASLVLLALAAGGFLALRADRDLLAGVLLAGMVIKPPYLLPLALVLLLTGRYRALAALAAGVAVFTALPVPIMGAGIMRGYAQILIEAGHWHTHSGGFSPAANENFAGFAALLLPRHAATAVQYALSAGALAVLALAARRSHSIDLPFALAVVCAVLINPHVLIHDLALLLVPAAVAVRHARSGPGWLPALLAAGYLGLLAGFRLVQAVPLQVAVLVMCALGVWLWLAEPRDTPAEGAVTGEAVA